MVRWARSGLREFPWRQDPQPYDVLLAELLLHRTRADLVETYYELLKTRCPTPAALAAAEPDEIERLLQPLGFSHRARRLPELGRMLVEKHGGKVPDRRDALLALPGVGPYIANAVLVISFGRRLPLLDPSVIRVMTRVFGYSSQRARPRDDPGFWDYLASLLPRHNVATFSLGLVDLGALTCRGRRPRCFECPLSDRCLALRTGAVHPAEPPRLLNKDCSTP